jgi:alpha-tubulin suppressor-like RCC1 family protein
MTSETRPRLRGKWVFVLAALLWSAAFSFLADRALAQSASATVLTSSANPASPGSPVTFTATVSGSDGGAPVGRVNLYDTATSSYIATNLFVNTLGVGKPISAGGHTSCAITSDRSVKCWGDNSQGQLGNTTADPNNPIHPSVDGVSDATAVTVGLNHACALTAAGGVKCWGDNQYGQLGSNTGINFDELNPPQIAVPVATDVVGLTSGVTAIAAGAIHTCALTSAGGVKCWGYNGYGQLGNSSTLNGSPHPIPADVEGLTSGVTAITTGDVHTCALTATGGVKCWGGNFSGSLGTGSDAPLVSVPSDVLDLTSGVTAIAGGSVHTCALTTDGGVKCWGDNQYAQLGNGGFPIASGAVAVAAGLRHSCALMSTGGVQCWGYNYNGQVGNTVNAGTFDNNPTPTDVNGLTSGVAAIAAGSQHTCALTSTGRANAGAGTTSANSATASPSIAIPQIPCRTTSRISATGPLSSTAM